ncbi:hypothetical protein DVH26_05715 [Paenibacillus sp. H1-7]|nr:hypothetical protein DVH26_05715 [Paenibacillus sp. H1-7]
MLWIFRAHRGFFTCCDALAGEVAVTRKNRVTSKLPAQSVSVTLKIRVTEILRRVRGSPEQL